MKSSSSLSLPFASVSEETGSPPLVSFTSRLSEDTRDKPHVNGRQQAILHIQHYGNENLPSCVLTHKCAIKDMQKIIDELTVYDDPSFSKKDEEGKLIYHRGLCTTLITRDGTFVKTYSKGPGKNKPLFGVILNHENMVTLLASPRNIATNGHFHASNVVIQPNSVPKYRGNRSLNPFPRTISNYQVESGGMVTDTSKIMEAYEANLRAIEENRPIDPHEMPKLIRGRKIAEHNEILVAKKESSEKTCMGIFVDVLSHNDMMAGPVENFFRKNLFSRVSPDKPMHSKDIFQRSMKRNMRILEGYRENFKDLKAVCASNSLPFYVRNLDADNKPQIQEIDLSTLHDFKDFVRACSGATFSALDTISSEIGTIKVGSTSLNPNAENLGEQTPKTLPSQSDGSNIESNLTSCNQWQLPSQEWLANLAEIVGHHFSKPYKYTTHKWLSSLTREVGGIARNDKIKRHIDGVDYIVFRRKHGLAHGVRQSFLALDIVTACEAITNASGMDMGVQLMREWVHKKKQTDRNFVKKLQFAAAFLRSGRESEVNSGASSYHIYKQRDAENFLKMSSQEDNPFDTDEERQLYADSILEKGEQLEPGVNDDLRNLSKILRASHMLDLRRLMHFDENRIKSDVAKRLFGDAIVVDSSISKFIENLWIRSGEYLVSTGDTDLVKQACEKYKDIALAYDDKFFTLSNDPSQLVKALCKARAESLSGF